MVYGPGRVNFHNYWKYFFSYFSSGTHSQMSLSEFKFIWYMEYFHRMWGRTIGLVFAIPAVYFLRKGWISKAMKPRLAIYGSLLVFQVWIGEICHFSAPPPGTIDLPLAILYRGILWKFITKTHCVIRTE
jgi:cytochrome c oxidase assembly protein subunit 15